MKLVVLESYVLAEGDLNWGGVQALVPEITYYGRTPNAEIAARIGDADFVVLNKCPIDEGVLAACPNLKWVGVLATGTDRIDLDACRAHGVSVAHVPSYSTHSVAQLTFALLLTICQCPERQGCVVQDGHWQVGVPDGYQLLPQTELCGKTFGIFGYGDIGKQVATLAKAFGMRVIVCTRTVRAEYASHGVEFVDFETLLAQSDVLSLHAPATPATKEIINAAALAKLKRGCILLNTARGALVDEGAVLAACKGGQLRFYAADVLATEPARAGEPLLGVENILITPHIGWATAESLEKLMVIVAQNLKTFLAGDGENILNE